MRRYLSTLLGLTLAATPLEAQGLRDKISQLFIFADGKDPLFLGGTAGSDSATALHADHFVPSAVSDNGTLISFIGTAISQNVANLPVSATSGGSTFRFEGGVPVPTRSEEHTSELQSRLHLVCPLLLEKKKQTT